MRRSTPCGNSHASSASRQRRATTSRSPRPQNGSSRSTSRAEPPRKVVRRHDCGYRACGFIQDLCRNTIGPDRGKLIVLRKWQHAILHGLFTKKGQPRIRIGLIGLPRKNGKSTLGAAIALYGLVCLGAGAHVYSCAGDRTQAGIVFNEAKRMVRAEPELSEIITIYRMHMEGPGDSIYRVLSADAKLQQGLNPSLVIFDEVHVQPNRDLWDAMILGMGTRARPMMIGITTAGFDRTTLAWELYELGRAGEIYFWWAEPADPNANWTDEKVWYEANPALGDFLHLGALRDDVRVTPESAFRRYHLNQWTTTQAAWLPHGAWAAAVDATRQFSQVDPFVGFLDGSWSNDSTGIVTCTLESPHLSVHGLWEPDPELGHIDMNKVEVRVRELLKMPGCRGLAFDPARFQDFFSRLESEGYDGSRADMPPVIEWHTNSLVRMVPACQEFYTAVMEKTIHHDGDARLASHIANAVLKEDRHGPRIVKESKTSKRKIDLAVCAVGSYSEALRLAAETPPASIYEREHIGVTFVDYE